MVDLINDAVNHHDNYTELQQAAHGIRTNVGGEFVNLFAAIAPEEDFIKTYKFKVLKDRNIDLMLSLSPIPLLNLPKTVSDSSPKVGCSGALGLLTPSPDPPP